MEKLVKNVLKNIRKLKKEREAFYNKYKDLRKEVKSIPDKVSFHDSKLRRLEDLAETLRYEVKELDFRLVKELGLINNKLSNLDGRVGSSNPDSLRPALVELTDSISEIRDLIKLRVDDLEERMEAISRQVEFYELPFRLFEILNEFSRIGAEPVRIRERLRELETLIQKMKRLGLWSKEKLSSTVSFLEDLAYSWSSYGYEDVAELYRIEAKKLSGERMKKKRRLKFV